MHLMNASSVMPHRSNAPPVEMARADMIDGLRKGLEVICAFDDGTPKLTQSELAQRLDLSRAAARRYLMTLTALGYMATDGKSFWLTPKVMRLGHSYTSSARLPRTVLPFLQKLTETLGESTSLVALEDEDAVYITRASAAKLLSTTIEPGTRLPAHTTAAGRLLLSLKPDAELDRWVYVGDSTNDQLMFQHFPHSVGVANIARFVPQLSHLPRYVTRAERGAGFAELVAHLRLLQK